QHRCLCAPGARSKAAGELATRVKTEGYACPNQQCPYFGITDAQIHALVGDGTHGQAERIQTFRCQACRNHVQCSTPYAVVPFENPLSADCYGAHSTGRRARPFGGRTGLRLPSDHHHEPFSLEQASMLRSSMSAASATCTFRTCSWMKFAHGSAAPPRC